MDKRRDGQERMQTQREELTKGERQTAERGRERSRAENHGARGRSVGERAGARVGANEGQQKERPRADVTKGL